MSQGQLVRGVKDMLYVLRAILRRSHRNLQANVEGDSGMLILFHSFLGLEIDYLESLINRKEEE